MKYVVLFLVFLGMNTRGLAQDVPLPEDTVETQSFLENPEQLLYDLDYLLSDILDSNERIVFLSGPVIGNLLVQSAHERGLSPLTYQVMMDLVLDMKKKYIEEVGKEAYKEQIWRMGEIRRMNDEVASPEGWPHYKEILGEYGPSGAEEGRLDSLVPLYANGERTYREVLAFIDAEERRRLEGKYDDLFVESSAVDTSALMAESKEKGRPIVIYFTGYNCVNCRRIEQGVLKDNKILQRLAEEFILANAYVDDRRELPEKMQRTEMLGERSKQIKTVGDHNIALQINTFGTTAQPYFVFLSADLEVLEVATYSNCGSTRDFEAKIDSALARFKE